MCRGREIYPYTITLGNLDPDSCFAFAPHEGLVPFIEDRIRENQDLFTKIYEDQMQELLITPFLALKLEEALGSHPRLIVVDGLGECNNEAVQCELLRVHSLSPSISYNKSSRGTHC